MQIKQSEALTEIDMRKFPRIAKRVKFFLSEDNSYYAIVEAARDRTFIVTTNRGTARRFMSLKAMRAFLKEFHPHLTELIVDVAEQEPANLASGEEKPETT